MRRLVLVSLCLVLLLPSTSARAQETLGQRVLAQRTVVLSMSGSSGTGSCLGFRLYREDFPPDVDLVLTAAHCVTGVGSNPLVTATTLGGQTGRAVAWATWADFDVAFLLVVPRLGSLDPIRDSWSQPPSGLPVLAMIRVGGGAPTIASGWVLEQEGYHVRLVMPGAPGSSGGGVVDQSGALVGMIVTGVVVVRGAASPFVRVVGAELIVRLLAQERERLAERARQLSSAALPLPFPSPPSLPSPPPTVAPTPVPAPLPAPTPSVTATPPSVQPAATETTLIAPGVGIGQIRLGMSVQEAYQILGREGRKESLPGALGESYARERYGTGAVALHRWFLRPLFVSELFDPHILVLEDQSGRVGAVGVQAAREFRTVEGLGPGSGEAEIRQRYGTPASVAERGGYEADRMLVYGPAGIRFRIMLSNYGHIWPNWRGTAFDVVIFQPTGR